MKIINWLAETKIRIDRGMNIVYWLRNMFIIVAAVKIIIPSMTLAQSFIFGISIILAFYFIGWFDLKYLGLMQKESALRDSKYNPHLNKISKFK